MRQRAVGARVAVVVVVVCFTPSHDSTIFETHVFHQILRVRGESSDRTTVPRDTADRPPIVVPRRHTALVKILYVDLDSTSSTSSPASTGCPPPTSPPTTATTATPPGIFALMDPLPGAIEAFNELSELFDAYILSTAPGTTRRHGPTTAVGTQHHRRRRGTPAYKRLILSHRKHLNAGDYIIDDRTKNGVSEFQASTSISGNPDSRRGNRSSNTCGHWRNESSLRPEYRTPRA